MSAPINTRPRNSHFSNPSAAVAPPVSTAFPIQTERRPSADAENMRKAHVFVPFV